MTVILAVLALAAPTPLATAPVVVRDATPPPATSRPYPGPNGTRWAIPWYIINCERDKSLGMAGIWRSHNPSGAIGPYQLLGHGAPWPANTPAARRAHHRIASRLWAGGAGAHHWVCA